MFKKIITFVVQKIILTINTERYEIHCIEHRVAKPSSGYKSCDKQ